MAVKFNFICIGVDILKSMPVSCPFCGGELLVREFYCRRCDTACRGHFEPGPVAGFDEEKLPILRRFARLSPQQLELLEAFVRCEGKLNRLQDELGVSYPKLRNLLNDMLASLGYTPEGEEEAAKSDRGKILDDLAAGKISVAEATRLLKETRP
ncbi:MAG: DUF2089 domain-containing protein [Chloroflexi bacterium]|nr:MAG: DUF2089 domain-containing protein [Chloroflexota bacterium]